jgi:iron-sulfur cluster repair protein YtfE (RIC family)
MELAPSKVRDRILEDHRALRPVLDRLEALARGLLQGRESVSDELLEQARVLDERMLEHMELEERILVPALREADAWGPERVERFTLEHERQREIMVAIRTAAAERPRVEFALIAWGFVCMLRDDMTEEERMSLNQRILPDEPVSPETD